MGFFTRLFAKPDSPDVKKVRQIIRQVERDVKSELAPLHAVSSAIIRAAHQCTERMKPSFPRKQTEQEAILCQMYVLYEFLYFFIHMTNRCTRNEEFTRAQFEEFQHTVYFHVIAVAIDSFMLDWPDEAKQKIIHEFYDNLNSAEMEYSTSKEVISEVKPYLGDSLLAKLSRRVAAKLDNAYNPVVMVEVTLVAHDELLNSNLDKLVGPAKAVLCCNSTGK